MRDLDRFFALLPPEEGALALALHHWLQEIGLQPRLRYGLPFYDRHRWICYMRPCALQGEIELCFTRAHQFEDPTALLRRRGRKQIKGIFLSPEEDLPIAPLQAILTAAMDLDKKG